MLAVIIYLLLCYIYILYEIITNYDNIKRDKHGKAIAGMAIVLSPILVIMVVTIWIKNKIK